MAISRLASTVCVNCSTLTARPCDSASAAVASGSSRSRRLVDSLASTAEIPPSSGLPMRVTSRSGLAGSSRVMASPTVPPMSASVNRPTANATVPSGGSTVAITTAVDEAWSTTIGPPLTTTAAAIASATTSPICQTPRPTHAMKRSATRMPTATPSTISSEGRSRRSNDTPIALMAASGAKIGSGRPRPYREMDQASIAAKAA